MKVITNPTLSCFAAILIERVFTKRLTTSSPELINITSTDVDAQSKQLRSR